MALSRSGYVTPTATFFEWFKYIGSIKTLGTGYKPRPAWYRPKEDAELGELYGFFFMLLLHCNGQIFLYLPIQINPSYRAIRMLIIDLCY